MPLARSRPLSSRARDLDVPFDGIAGPLNAITDVAGVSVGQVILNTDLADGRKVGTGVTAVLPRGRSSINASVFGAIALGHPLGASAARLAMTAAFALRRHPQSRALISPCVGVGQGWRWLWKAHKSRSMTAHMDSTNEFWSTRRTSR